ncbi:MAG TPA: cyclopropane-fatty-acyl-phospholipid synthase family protein [Candidatus Polarisedimenticolia bacterium]|nr:cyclopropane-fatty-acyl-phospholipid synthase family protein [Candidatus Polarisedimenticolia bacterium]
MPNTPGFSSIERRLVRRIENSLGGLPFQLVLGRDDGPRVLGSVSSTKVIISDRRTLVKLALDPEIGFGDGYSEGRIEVQGDLVAFLESVLRSMQAVQRESWYSKLSSWWLERLHGNTLRGSRENIHHHYDLNGDFYKLWLDSRMLYTCAYFPSDSATLEEAQLAKMDHVCRKARLQPGDKVIDAGCGWGALALHMAKHYGAKVRAFNISHEQIVFARERARKEGLDRQVEFIEDDYRNISGQWDAFMSIGMLEHVGKDHYRDLGRVIHRAIGDSGRGLLHFIGRNYPHPFSTWMRKRIFPGAYAPALSEVGNLFEPWNCSVLDVENLRPHYARTLEHWLSRFEASAERISQMFDSKFVRAWRLYLAGSIASFRVGSLQLFQILFAGSNCQQMPWTRAHLYEEQQPAKKERKWMHAMS